MRIGIDISQVIHGTGVSHYIKELVIHLAKIDKKNQYILFGASLRGAGRFNKLKEDLKDYQNIEFKIVRIPPTVLEPLWNKLHMWPIEKWIGETDIFHSSDWTQPPISKITTKKVTTVHDLIPYLFPQSTHPKIVKAQKRRFERVKKEVDIVLADSQTTKDDLIKFIGIEPEKIKVVYLAASEEFKPQYDEAVNQVLEKYKIKKPYILSVATQEPRKNIQKLIDAFAKVQKANPEFRLVLIGKYGWGEVLPAGRQGFHSAENVVWAGYVPQEDLPKLYSGCRVFVYPSLYEGFGLPILEAMSCGAPVVTSNNSSMLEIAKDAAILVDPRSEGQIEKAIEMIISLNLENYQKMVRASLDRGRKYSWTKTAKETLKIYEEVATKVDSK